MKRAATIFLLLAAAVAVRCAAQPVIQLRKFSSNGTRLSDTLSDCSELVWRPYIYRGTCLHYESLYLLYALYATSDCFQSPGSSSDSVKILSLSMTPDPPEKGQEVMIDAKLEFSELLSVTMANHNS